MKKLLITNVVYGKTYADIFLNYHLKSLLDSSNLPAHKDRVEYLLFTDQETLPILSKHPNIKKLMETIKVDARAFPWPKESVVCSDDKFNLRYEVLTTICRHSITEALERDSYLSPIVADLVFAKDTFTKIFAKLDEGYDSVFMLPMRTAAESMMTHLDKFEGAPDGSELFSLGFANLHPLWVSAHWETPQFTRMPYTLLWNSGSGLLARSFSITPIVFSPHEGMRNVTHSIDVEVPSLCKNPYWCTDWIDCPVIGVEPLFCYYPTFHNQKASVNFVKNWIASGGIIPSQLQYAATELFFPSREIVKATDDMLHGSDLVVQGIYSEA